MVWIPKEPQYKPKPPKPNNTPTNTSTDLISRQDAIDTLKRVAGVGNRALDALKNIPAAEADRRKGKWTEKEVVQDEKAKVIEEWQSARCSNCGRYHTTPYHYYFYEDNFCPNCGADMRGED